MRQAERLSALRALLARVEANAKERRAELAALGLGPDAPRPEAVVSEPPIHAPPPRVRARVPSPRGRFDDDDWSSLLTRDLNDPSPERRATPQEPQPPPEMPFSRVASFAPPPLPADLVKVVAQAAATPPARSDEEDLQPDSEIVKAIRLAAEHPHPVVDPRDMWTDAGPQMRERKPATNPPVPPRPEDLEPDDDEHVLDLVRLTPASSRVSSSPPPPEEPVATPPPEHPSGPPEPPKPPEPLPIAVPLDPHVATAHRHHDDGPVDELPAEATPFPVPSSYLARSRGRRIERAVSPRKQTANRVLAALVIAAPLAGLATWSLLDQPRREVREVASSDPRGAKSIAAVPPSIAPPSVDRPRLDPPLDPPRAPLGASGESAVPSAPTPPPTSIPPPPKVGNPRESGMIWVDADPASAIYVQGVAAGDSGKWLEVACGMKNVRLARPGLPPPGHSFPMWLGVGQTVLIPCGGSHRVALRPD